MECQILYVGYYTEDKVLYEIQSRGINNMSVARQSFEKNLLKSLIEQCRDSLEIVTYAPTDGVYEIPKESVFCGKTVKHIGIQKSNPSSLMSARKEFAEYLKSFGPARLQGMKVIMYDVNPVFLLPLLAIRKKYKISITTICAELSVLRRDAGIKYFLRNRILAFFERKFDRYILFAEAMADVLKCRKKPYMILEGIAPACFGTPDADKKNIIMYAGGLARDNNIRLLIDVCSHISELDELWICGVGEDEEYVANKAKEYPWLRYFGMVTNDEVRKMETQAKILINLRDPNEELTKYSFPSKLLEYVASGSLVVTTRLQGIPNEYFDYFIPINSIDERGVISVLTDALKMTSDEYISQCAGAQEFITLQKNAGVQTKKILDFVSNVSV